MRITLAISRTARKAGAHRCRCIFIMYAREILHTTFPHSLVEKPNPGTSLRGVYSAFVSKGLCKRIVGSAHNAVQSLSRPFHPPPRGACRFVFLAVCPHGDPPLPAPPCPPKAVEDAPRPPAPSHQVPPPLGCPIEWPGRGGGMTEWISPLQSG